MNFYTILTNSGINAIIQARALGNEVKLSKIAVGDGEIVPSQEMTNLESEKHRFNINTMKQDETNPGYLIIEGVIPSNIGGFYISEVAIYTEDDVLFAIGNLPRTYKPLLEEGSAKDLTIKMIIEVTNADSVNLMIDDSVVLATREFVEDRLESYMLISNAASKEDLNNLKIFVESQSIIKKPSIISPLDDAIDFIDYIQSSPISIDKSFKGKLDSVHWQIATDFEFTNIIDEEIDSIYLSYAPKNILPSTKYFIRVKHSSDNHLSSWSEVVSFTTPDIIISTPAITSPSNDSIGIGQTVILTSNPYISLGEEEVHLSTTWQIATDIEFEDIVVESVDDEVNLLSWKSGNLSTSTTYYARVKHKATMHESLYSNPIKFKTKDIFRISIGEAGKKGFSVAPTDQPFALLGLAEMTGTNEVGHDNYGNYIHTNGSIVCWCPKSYYRVGSPESERYETYGENALDFAGPDIFETEIEANEAGFALPRAFINAGKEKSGFFIDKYMNSKDGSSSSKSVFGGVPISLGSVAGYTSSNGMVGCAGIYADALVLSSARGARWNTTTAFIYGYIALVSLAQAQAATNTIDVAWYDATGVKNYPKGCNNNALSDVNDTSVTYVTAGDAGDAKKPKTGATANFAKTTHNGSANGIADLNGGMHEVAIGITNFGSSATSTTQITNNSLYILKKIVDHATLTSGWNGFNDAWGDASNLSSKYDLVTSPISINATITTYWGNGTNTVLQNDLQGLNRDICGFIPKNDAATSPTGANIFGNDYFYKHNVHNLVPLACGAWNNSGNAGLFARNFNYYRSSSSHGVSFRASAYFE
ncbi:MAG TPA: phage tail protein [Aliarcobacter sp.]|nr:phage tail protein [Aliarcobacter sp.]